MKLKVQALTAEAFAPYGTFVNMHDVNADGKTVFQPDRMLQYLGTSTYMSLSTLRVYPRPLELTETEYHDDCEEVFGGYGVDMLFHVALMGEDGGPNLDTIAVFKMPKGTFCRVKRRVFHHAPFVCDDNYADGTVLLSPAAYTTDCLLIDFDTPIEIEM